MVKQIIPISMYVGFKHNYNTTVMTFIGLESVKKKPTGGNWDQVILQKETK